MAFVRIVEESEATGDLARCFTEHRRRTGAPVAAILRVHGLHPDSLRAHLGLYRTLMFGRSPLSRRQREMLAVVVSAANRCAY